MYGILQGHKYRIEASLDTTFNNAIQVLRNVYDLYKLEVLNAIDFEKEKINAAKDAMILMSDLKTVSDTLEESIDNLSV